MLDAKLHRGSCDIFVTAGVLICCHFKEIPSGVSLLVGIAQRCSWRNYISL
jgi:hypothetical protein